MTKKSRRSLSKKGLVGLSRGKNSEGKKVWFYQNQEFPTLRDVRAMYPQN